MATQPTEPARESDEAYPEIDPRELELRDELEVVDIRVDYDSLVLGDMVPVWVIVDDETPNSELMWPSIEPVEREVREFFRDRELGLIPMVRFRTESEYEEQMGGAD